MRKPLVQTTLLPGNVRLVFQLYDPTRRSYTQPAGYSIVVRDVGSPQEFERLARGISSFVDDGARWRNARAQEEQDPNETIAHNSPSGAVQSEPASTGKL